MVCRVTTPGRSRLEFAAFRKPHHVHLIYVPVVDHARAKARLVVARRRHEEARQNQGQSLVAPAAVCKQKDVRRIRLFWPA